MKQVPDHPLKTTFGKTWSGFGIGLFFLSASGFTISILFSSMAFHDGISIGTTNAVRYFLAVSILFVFQKIRGKQLKLPLRERHKALALGIPVFMIGLGYLGATQYIPVSLAVLIFYSFPIIVAVISNFTENEPITIIRLVAIILALTGLGLALEIQSVNTLDWRGIGFALMASFGCAVLVIMSSLTMKTADPQAVNFHCLTAGTVLFAAFFLFAENPANSINYSGWLKLGVSSTALALGYVTLFTGLELVGPVKSSVLMNMEPILTIILAAILLGERLSPVQAAGAGLVIVGIVLITHEGGKIAEKT